MLSYSWYNATLGMGVLLWCLISAWACWKMSLCTGAGAILGAQRSRRTNEILVWISGIFWTLLINKPFILTKYCNVRVININLCVNNSGLSFNFFIKTTLKYSYVLKWIYELFDYNKIILQRLPPFFVYNNKHFLKFLCTYLKEI